MLGDDKQGVDRFSNVGSNTAKGCGGPGAMHEADQDT